MKEVRPFFRTQLIWSHMSKVAWERAYSRSIPHPDHQTLPPFHRLINSLSEYNLKAYIRNPSRGAAGSMAAADAAIVFRPRFLLQTSPSGALRRKLRFSLAPKKLMWEQRIRVIKYGVLTKLYYDSAPYRYEITKPSRNFKRLINKATKHMPWIYAKCNYCLSVDSRPFCIA